MNDALRALLVRAAETGPWLPASVLVARGVEPFTPEERAALLEQLVFAGRFRSNTLVHEASAADRERLRAWIPEDATGTDARSWEQRVAEGCKCFIASHSPPKSLSQHEVEAHRYLANRGLV